MAFISSCRKPAKYEYNRAYLGGKESALKALMGAVMKLTDGRAEPKAAKRAILRAGDEVR